MTWQERAACIGADPDLFHPDDPDKVPSAAAALCATCRVQGDCLEYALANETSERSQWSVWAGTTYKQRRNIRRRRQRNAKTLVGS